MQVKKHKALDRKDQSSKRLTTHTYTKGNMGRTKTTWGRDNRTQPQRNQRISWRPEIAFKSHIPYTNENIIQTWSCKPGERESYKRCEQRWKLRRDEKTERKRETKQNQQTMKLSSSYEREHWSHIPKN